MILENLEPSEIRESLVILALRIIIEEIDITTVEYIEFTQRLTNINLKQAYFDMLR